MPGLNSRQVDMRNDKDRYSVDTEEKYQLTDFQRWVLCKLKRTPGIGSETLANRMKVLPSVCGSLICELAESGHLSPMDRTSQPHEDRFRLTDQGLSALVALKKRVF